MTTVTCPRCGTDHPHGVVDGHCQDCGCPIEEPIEYLDEPEADDAKVRCAGGGFGHSEEYDIEEVDGREYRVCIDCGRGYEIRPRLGA